MFIRNFAGIVAREGWDAITSGNLVPGKFSRERLIWNYNQEEAVHKRSRSNSPSTPGRMVLFSTKLKYFLAISSSCSVWLRPIPLRFSPGRVPLPRQSISARWKFSLSLSLSLFRWRSVGHRFSAARSILTGIYGDKSHEIRLNVVHHSRHGWRIFYAAFPAFPAFPRPFVPHCRELKCNFINEREGECQIIARICQPAGLHSYRGILHFSAVASTFDGFLGSAVCWSGTRQTFDAIRILHMRLVPATRNSVVSFQNFYYRK